jgi:hypothetical protein
VEKIQTVVSFDGEVCMVSMPSASRRGLNHKVLLACTCEGFQRGGFCYHLSAAADVIHGDVRAQALRTRQRMGKS